MIKTQNPPDLADRVKAFIREQQTIRQALALAAPELIQSIMQHVSLREAARQTGLSPTYVSSVLNGRQQISMHAFIELSQYYERIASEHRESGTGNDTGESD